MYGIKATWELSPPTYVTHGHGQCTYMTIIICTFAKSGRLTDTSYYILFSIVFYACYNIIVYWERLVFPMQKIIKF